MKRNVIIAVLVLIMCVIFSTVTFAKTGSIQNSDYLNLRESATTSSNLIVKMPGDATFEILGEEDDWYKVKYQDYTGYVSKQYVKVQETVVSNVPAKANSKGIVNKESDIYTLPLLNSIKLDKMSANSEVTIVSVIEKWAYIQNDTISGWVFASNVNTIEETATEEQNSETQNDNQDMDNTQENSEQTAQNSSEQENNTQNDEQENNESNDINEENNSNDEQTSSTSSNVFPRTMYVNVEAVYVRAEKSTDSEKVTSIGLNTPVMVNGEDGEWYKVTTGDGSGYMMKKYLSNEKQE